MLESLAYDKSCRHIDVYGRLHVQNNPLTKAAVNPYVGSEILNYKELGLSPTKIYMLYRDPEELRKAAPSFSNVPILSQHTLVTAENPEKPIVAGTVGSEIVFDGEYLRSDIAIWDAECIAEINNGLVRQISAGYRYTADMTPGETDSGVPYDGVMREIVANHVALVPKGRAGPDVLVVDSGDKVAQVLGRQASRTPWCGWVSPPFLGKGITRMKTKIALDAALLAGSLGTYLPPRLVSGHGIDITTLVRDAIRDNWRDTKAAVHSAVLVATRGKLATDATVDDLVEVLASLDNTSGESVVRDMDLGEEDKKEEEEEPKKSATDESDLAEKVRALLSGKISDEDLAAVIALITPAAAAMVGEEAEEMAKTKEMAKNEPEDTVSRAAMDAAIRAAVTKVGAEQQLRAGQIIAALARVRPLVGELSSTNTGAAFDSADAVYRTALNLLSIPIDGVHPSAFPHLLDMYRRTTPRQIATDHAPRSSSAAATTLLEKYPGLANARVI